MVSWSEWPRPHAQPAASKRTLVSGLQSSVRIECRVQARGLTHSTADTRVPCRPRGSETHQERWGNVVCREKGYREQPQRLHMSHVHCGAGSVVGGHSPDTTLAHGPVNVHAHAAYCTMLICASRVGICFPLYCIRPHVVACLGLHPVHALVRCVD